MNKTSDTMKDMLSKQKSTESDCPASSRSADVKTTAAAEKKSSDAAAANTALKADEKSSSTLRRSAEFKKRRPLIKGRSFKEKDDKEKNDKDRIKDQHPDSRGQAGVQGKIRSGTRKEHRAENSKGEEGNPSFHTADKSEPSHHESLAETDLDKQAGRKPEKNPGSRRIDKNSEQMQKKSDQPVEKHSDKKMDDTEDSVKEIPVYPFIVFIQFEESKKAYSFGTDLMLQTNDLVVVETVRGQEIGKVFAPSQDFDLSKVKGDLKPVLRKATEEDLQRREENEKKAKQSMKICQQSIAKLQLDMHLISCEYTLDGSKVIFTYVSDDRVDFRGLLKDLASKLQGRIELRQVGPRNKAKMVGGIGSCGMECCCSRFMSDFDTVSINMAKNQLLALNISKLSGQCGKLMCCLRFENDEYTRMRQGLPRLNSQIEYEGKRYRVSSMNLLQKQAKLENREETVFVPMHDLWPDWKGEDDSTEEL